MTEIYFYDFLKGATDYFKKDLLFPKGAYLYHYTNLSGLMGILKDRKIYSTDSRFLNDTSEQIYAREYIVEKIEKRIASKQYATLKLWRNLLIRVKEWNLPKVFITSFSKDNDLLSMWRAYGENNSSFSLGFGKYSLVDNTNPRGSILNVIYTTKEQEEFLNWTFEKIEEYYKTNQGSFNNIDNQVAEEILNYFSMLLPIIKHPKFVDEQEARLVIPENKLINSNITINYRSSSRGLIQYIETDVMAENAPFPIDEIMIGPTSDKHNLKESISDYIKFCGIENLEDIQISSIPFRH